MYINNKTACSTPITRIHLLGVFILASACLSCGGSDAPVRKGHGGAPIPTPEIVFVVPTPSAQTKSNEQQLSELLDAKKSVEAVALFIESCVSAPKKGYAPSFSFSSSFPLQASKELQSMHAKLSAEEKPDLTKLRCLIAALARHPNPGALQAFWRTQLNSKDQQTRWWAILELSKIADDADLEAVLVQAIEVPDLGSLISKRIVQWKSSKAVPFLVDIAKNSDAFSAKRAKRSLDALGYSDALSDTGKYEKEFAWWTEVNSKYEAIKDIARPWRTDARSVTK